MCDKDKDGLLDDYELLEFQTFVFKAELKKQHITALKQVLINQGENEDNEEQLKKGLNFEAFVELQKLLITKMKQQTCWTILRFFQYDDKLQIKNERLFDE